MQRQSRSASSGTGLTLSLDIPQQLHLLPSSGNLEKRHTPCAGCCNCYVGATGAEGYGCCCCLEQAAVIHDRQGDQVRSVDNPVHQHSQQHVRSDRGSPEQAADCAEKGGLCGVLTAKHTAETAAPLLTA
jgi:hypothetical protein